MTKRTWTILFLFLILTGCVVDKETRIDRILDAYSGQHTPGAAVSIIHNGEKVFHRGFGMANIEDSIEVGTATNFRLASITKQFTAMSIMMLIDRRQLDLDTPIREIFPEMQPFADEITIEHLLHHTSGMLDYESLIPDTATVQVHDADVLQMMTQADSTYFAPDEAYQYSNSGYAVLAMVIEKLSGMSFPDFLEVNIFQPLKMEGTLAFVEGTKPVPMRALGYTVHADSIEQTDQSLTRAVLGDGGIYSSIDDLYLWDQALYTNMLVSDSLMRLAFTPHKELYGFGWRIDSYKGHKRYRHSGSTSGFRNFISRFPDDSLTVIVLTNRSSPAVREPAEEIVDLYLVDDKISK
ncbi:MAG: serine hydrolase [Rhodothermales bacterium]|nr:serine hydrolase [Rhodothermales bacterium]